MKKSKVLTVLMATLVLLWGTVCVAQEDKADAAEKPAQDEAGAKKGADDADGEGEVQEPGDDPPARPGESKEGAEADGDSVEEADEEEVAARLAAQRKAAQASVTKARKLIKIQRYDQAITLLQDAFLILEDPELIRILGEVHLAKGEEAAAMQFFDDYLADVTVGEMSKASVRQKREGISKVANKAKGQGVVKEDEEDSFLNWNWESPGAASGEVGQFYLELGMRLTHHQGDEFSTALGGDGPPQKKQSPHSGSTVAGEGRSRRGSTSWKTPHWASRWGSTS